MSNNSMTLIQAVQQGGDEDLLRPGAEVALAKLMAFEVEGLGGAAKGRHSAERHPYRQGYRERPLHRPLGHTGIAHPEATPRDRFPLVSGTAAAQ